MSMKELSALDAGWFDDEAAPEVPPSSDSDGAQRRSYIEMLISMELADATADDVPLSERVAI